MKARRPPSAGGSKGLKRGDSVRDKITGQEGEVLVVVHVLFHREVDGRWIADVPEMPGVTAYGATRDEAFAAARKLVLEVISDRLDHGEDLLTGRPQKPTRPGPAAPFRLEIAPVPAVAG